MSLLAQLESQAAVAKEAYRELVRKDAEGQAEPDPAEARQIIAAAGHDLEAFKGHVAWVRQKGELQAKADSLESLNARKNELIEQVNTHRAAWGAAIEKARLEFEENARAPQLELLTLEIDLEAARLAAFQLGDMLRRERGEQAGHGVAPASTLPAGSVIGSSQYGPQLVGAAG